MHRVPTRHGAPRCPRPSVGQRAPPSLVLEEQATHSSRALSLKPPLVLRPGAVFLILGNRDYQLDLLTVPRCLSRERVCLTLTPVPDESFAVWEPCLCTSPRSAWKGTYFVEIMTFPSFIASRLAGVAEVEADVAAKKVTVISNGGVSKEEMLEALLKWSQASGKSVELASN